MADRFEQFAESLETSTSDENQGKNLVAEAYSFMNEHKGEFAVAAAITATVIATKGKALAGLLEKEAVVGTERLAANSTELLIGSGTSITPETRALMSLNRNNYAPFRVLH